MSQEKQENPAPQTDSPSAPAPDKPAKNNKPVVIYIMILFIAAFLLMALSFFMHQRSNTEALGELQSSVNAMQEIQISQEQIIELQEAVDDLEERNAALETELEETADLLDEARNQLQALQSLEELERLASGNGEERQEAAQAAEALLPAHPHPSTAPRRRAWSSLSESCSSRSPLRR